MITIAIDGPSGAGKSMTAKALSQKLNILHLNTGALYRAIAVYLDEHNIPADNEEEIKKILDKIDISVEFENGQQKTFLNGEEVTNKLYTSNISRLVSPSSAFLSVRNKILDLQRNVAKHNSVIMEGRDITSHVLPNAKYKFFLTASPEVRAMRRFKDLQKTEPDLTYEKVLQDIIERDLRDSTREVRPLVKTEDSILINSDNLTQEEVIDTILSYIKEKE